MQNKAPLHLSSSRTVRKRAETERGQGQEVKKRKRNTINIIIGSTIAIRPTMKVRAPLQGREESERRRTKRRRKLMRILLSLLLILQSLLGNRKSSSKSSSMKQVSNIFELKFV